MATMKRKPSQEELSDALAYDDIAAAEEALGASGNEQVNLEELSVEAQKPPKEPVEGLDEKSISQITRAFTGASPALMGLLFGASPATSERQLKETQDYYKAGVPTKAVLTKGPAGEPIYTDIREAVGQEAYEKPVATIQQQQRLLQSRRMVDLDKINDPTAKAEEKYKMVRDTLDGPVDAMSGESLKGRKLIDAGTDQILRLPTPGGGVNFESYNKILDKKKSIAGTLGAGEIMGAAGKPLLKSEAELLLKSASKAKDLIAIQNKEIQGISADRSTSVSYTHLTLPTSP
jgi:hypothetical protein